MCPRLPGPLLEVRQELARGLIETSIKVIPQYCIAHPYWTRFSRH